MKPEQQIKALAELDGWREIRCENIGINKPVISHPIYFYTGIKDELGGFEPIPRYLTSHDAIIPLRIKVCNTPALKVAWLNHARTIVARRVGKLVSDFDIASIKPDEDCEALLRATGKWTDDGP